MATLLLLQWYQVYTLLENPALAREQLIQDKMKKLHIAGICVALILTVYCATIAARETQTLIVSVYVLVCSFRAALLVAFTVLYVALLRHIRAKKLSH